MNISLFAKRKEGRRQAEEKGRGSKEMILPYSRPNWIY
jgi:hypothetical protein